MPQSNDLPRPEQDRLAFADRYTGESCYLDGKPATVTGRLNRFATIAALDGTHSAEYGWYAVALTMESGKSFCTYGKQDQRGYLAR